MSTALQHGGLSRPLRVLAAALIVVFGGVHLMLWAQEYKDVKIIGILFLLNAVAAVVIAVALITKPLGAFALGGLGLSLLTLVAFGLSRTIGLFGFAEHELGGRSAMVAAVAEAGAIVVLGLWYQATRPRRGAAPVVGTRQEPPAAP
jgi:hypothetical protein